MIAPNSILMDTCSMLIINCESDIISRFMLHINHSENAEEHMSIIEKGGNGNYWTVSLYEPKYTSSESNGKMSEEQKSEFIKLINSNWEYIKNRLDHACEEICGDDKEKCNHYCNRHLPDNPPDYTKL